MVSRIILGLSGRGIVVTLKRREGRSDALFWLSGRGIVETLKRRVGQSDALFWASPRWKKRRCNPETKSGTVRCIILGLSALEEASL